MLYAFAYFIAFINFVLKTSIFEEKTYLVLFYIVLKKETSTF